MATHRSRSSNSSSRSSNDTIESPGYNPRTYSPSSLSVPRNLLEAKDSTLFTFHHSLEKFVASSDTRLCLPKYLTPQQKNYLLTLVQCMGLRIKRDRSEDAYVVKTNATYPFVRMLVLARESKLKAEGLFHLLRNKEPQKDIKQKMQLPMTLPCRPGASVSCGLPQIPKLAKSNVYTLQRESLPIFKHRQQILDTIANNTFTIVRGPTGSGKSTQIPQYIMEEAAQSGTPIRVLICLPRRSAVVGISDRVALERGEKVGQSIGYQIHLENCYSLIESVVHFVTGSILLRALVMPTCDLISNCTHIIMDELQCRERHQDLIMNCLRDLVDSKSSNLRVIGVCQDVPPMDFLPGYFSCGGDVSCSQVKITEPEHLQNVTIYYLEDILRFRWSTHGGANTHYMYTFTPKTDEQQKLNNAKLYNINVFIEHAWNRVNAEACLYDFLQLVRDDEISVDYAHSVTAVTMLMAVCVSGLVQYAEILLDLGANPYPRSSNGYTARDWAMSFAQDDIVNLLERKVSPVQRNLAHASLNPMDCVLKEYFKRVGVHNVDFILIVRLIHMIHSVDVTTGSVLVFLPTYEDLTQLKDLISRSVQQDPGWNSTGASFVIHYLHEFIQSSDQRGALEKSKPNQRKIILSTDVGGECLTFPDVAFVVDCGRSKQARPEPVLTWISKIEASQRTARILQRSRGGVCYRLYSRKRFYNDMLDYPCPEVERSPYLLSLCLQTQGLLQKGVSIQDFFECLPSPPPQLEVEKAVKTLKDIGAIHETDEELTDLGMHLLDFQTDPRWAKALLYAVVFKCLDPILTLAASMSYNEAFIPQHHPHFRMLAQNRKLDLSGDTFSDHMAILKAFQRWEAEKSKSAQHAQDFCDSNFISASTFDVVYGIRNRLLGQLRASGFIRNKGIHNVKDVNENSNNWCVVKAVMCIALFPNVCVVNRISQVLFDRSCGGMQFHPCSTLALQNYDYLKDLPSDWIIYDEKVEKDGQVWVKGCTAVNAATIALLAGDLSVPVHTTFLATPLVHGTGFAFTEVDRICCSPHENKVRISIDDWIQMFSFDTNITSIFAIRQRIKDIVSARLRRPELFPTKMEIEVIQTVVRILTIEDSRVGLKQSSVGQWPKLVSGNLLSVPRAGFEVTR